MKKLQDHCHNLFVKYQQDRDRAFPDSFRLEFYDQLQHLHNHSHEIIKSLIKSIDIELNEIPSDSRKRICVFIIGSTARQEASDESDVDMIFVVDDSEMSDDALTNLRKSIYIQMTKLIGTRTDLNFEHRNEIVRGEYNFAESAQYPVVPISQLVTVTEYRNRRMQVLFEARVLYNHNLAEAVWNRIIETYHLTASDHADERLICDFKDYFIGYWEHFFTRQSAHIANDRIVKLMLYREVSYFSSAISLAYVLQKTTNPGDMVHPGWSTITPITNAPLANKLFCWCKCADYLPPHGQIGKPRSALDKLISTEVDCLTDENKKLFGEWSRGKARIVPIPYYSLSVKLQLLVQVYLADCNDYLRAVSSSEFKDRINSAGIDPISWETNPDLMKVKNAGESIRSTERALSNSLAHILNWMDERKSLVSGRARALVKQAQSGFYDLRLLGNMRWRAE